jgi:hypothetical protein
VIEVTLFALICTTLLYYLDADACLFLPSRRLAHTSLPLPPPLRLPCQTHVRAHTRPFECPLPDCRRRFGWSVDLKRHIEKIHKRCVWVAAVRVPHGMHRM